MEKNLVKGFRKDIKSLQLRWAVIADLEAKNDGKIDNFQCVEAVFNYPFLAFDYIKKVLPSENRSRFHVVDLITGAEALDY